LYSLTCISKVIEQAVDNDAHANTLRASHSMLSQRLTDVEQERDKLQLKYTALLDDVQTRSDGRTAPQHAELLKLYEANLSEVNEKEAELSVLRSSHLEFNQLRSRVSLVNRSFVDSLRELTPLVTDDNDDDGGDETRHQQQQQAQEQEQPQPQLQPQHQLRPEQPQQQQHRRHKRPLGGIYDCDDEGNYYVFNRTNSVDLAEEVSRDKEVIVRLMVSQVVCVLFAIMMMTMMMTMMMMMMMMMMMKVM
jgi:hypothetical protein